MKNFYHVLSITLLIAFSSVGCSSSSKKSITEDKAQKEGFHSPQVEAFLDRQIFRP